MPAMKPMSGTVLRTKLSLSRLDLASVDAVGDLVLGVGQVEGDEVLAVVGLLLHVVAEVHEGAGDRLDPDRRVLAVGALDAVGDLDGGVGDHGVELVGLDAVDVSVPSYSASTTWLAVSSQ